MKVTKKNLTLAALLAAVSLSAQAADTFNLRALNGEANWTNGDPDNATLRYRDWFNDGNAQTGATYDGGLNAPANLYTVSGSSLGAETTPGDFTIDGQMVGQFSFSRGNASTPTLLNVNGNLFSNQSHFLRMNGPTNASGGGDTLFRQGRPNFAGSSAWTFVTPDAGARYGMRFTDANIGDVGFDDLISLDVIGGLGGPSAQLRRIAGNETTGERTITEIETKSFADGVFAGMSLADVNLIAMHMYWDAGTNEISADIEMLRVSNGGASIELVGELIFNNRYDIFNGVDKLDPSNRFAFTRLQVGAQWSDAVTAPVPEPSTYALMAGGLLAVGWTARRRRRT